MLAMITNEKKMVIDKASLLCIYYDQKVTEGMVYTIKYSCMSQR